MNIFRKFLEFFFVCLSLHESRRHSWLFRDSFTKSARHSMAYYLINGSAFWIVQNDLAFCSVFCVRVSCVSVVGFARHGSFESVHTKRTRHTHARCMNAIVVCMCVAFQHFVVVVICERRLLLVFRMLVGLFCSTSAARSADCSCFNFRRTRAISATRIYLYECKRCALPSFCVDHEFLFLCPLAAWACVCVCVCGSIVSTKCFSWLCSYIHFDGVHAGKTKHG